MRLIVGAGAGDAAARAVEVVVCQAEAALAARGRFVLALSGGRGPVPFFEQLARSDLDWARTWLVQVDERVAPDGDPARNLGVLTECLGPVIERLGGFVPVPVDPSDPPGTADAYGRLLTEVAGDPPVLDLVHLGLGADGHTASLVPGDPVVDEAGRWVASSGEYEGHRRVTLTRPVLDRARHRLWYVVGDGKGRALARLLRHDQGIPAGLISPEATTVVVDRAALGLGPPPAGSRLRRVSGRADWPPARPG